MYKAQNKKSKNHMMNSLTIKKHWKKKTQEYFPAILDLADAETGKSFGDLSGTFPICSLSGN
eukprot:12920033-Ditylum_brightwellii.AAC.1